MRSRLVPLGAVLYLAAAPAALAADLAYGEYLAQECAACHRHSGDPGAIPMLDGIEADYFMEAMFDYQAGLRDNVAMETVARSLDDDQLEALAAWFASQKPYWEDEGDEDEQD